MRVAILGVALVVCGLLIGSQADNSPPAAEASFHEMRIYAVMAGVNDDDSIQYVELRMATNNQNLVSGKVLCFFSGSGQPFRRFTFPANVDPSPSGSSILIGTAAMDAVWPHEPDFIFDGNTINVPGGGTTGALPVPWPGGKVAFGTDSAPDAANACAAGFNEIDSVAYGASFGGTVDHGSRFASDIPVSGEQALQLQGAVCYPPSCTRNNSTDYAIVQNPQPRNNSGQSAGIGDTTPTPAPTATPTDAPTATPAATTPGTSVAPAQGDANCDGEVDEDDGIEVLEHVADIDDVSCPVQADVTCDGIDAIDALRIFQYLTNLSNFCAP